MSENIRIAAIDDHPMFIEGLRRGLRSRPELTFVGIGYSAADARRIAETDEPDILLLDIGIPGGGLAAARHVASQCPKVKVVMLTGSENDDHVAAALAAGAKGFVVKGAGAEEVADAVTSVYRGVPYVSQAIASRLLVQKIGATPALRAGMLERLNFRERQVLECAARGHTNRDIAMELNLQVRTVKNYMSRILQKLQARNRVAAIACFVSNGTPGGTVDA